MTDLDEMKKPTGYVATCQHGIVIGAIDLERTDRKEGGKILGAWIGKGCTLEPRFTGSWSVSVKSCEVCRG